MLILRLTCSLNHTFPVKSIWDHSNNVWLKIYMYLILGTRFGVLGKKTSPQSMEKKHLRQGFSSFAFMYQQNMEITYIMPLHLLNWSMEKWGYFLLFIINLTRISMNLSPTKHWSCSRVTPWPSYAQSTSLLITWNTRRE